MITRMNCAHKMALSALYCEIVYIVWSQHLIGRHRFRRCDKNTTALIDVAPRPIRREAYKRGGEIGQHNRNEDSGFL